MSYLDQSYDVFKMFDSGWALAAAGTPEDYNAMTISWGTLGTIWSPEGTGRSIVTIFVRKSRYTLEYLNKTDHFSVSFFPKEYKKALGYLGSHSGRTEPDKVRTAGLTPQSAGQTVGFKEASRTFICKKMFSQELLLENIPKDVIDRFYKDGDAHIMFIGEIEEVIEN